MDRMQEILEGLAKRRGMAHTFEPMSAKDYEQFKVDGLNNTEGSMHLEDGYNCHICKNKGYVFKVVEHEDGSYSYVCADCKCAEIRRSIMRMKRSGLEDVIKKYTFERYEDTEPWQKAAKAAAVNYADNPEGWFFLGGQSGCGKTHLCTAICREFLLDGRQVIYMLWRDDIAKIKALSLDSEERDKMINRFKRAEVLYIDDLFKTGKDKDGNETMPTAADVNAAFEIINYRYCNPELLTIISTERSADELIDIDEATGGRIFERSKAINIAKDRNKNYRLKGTVTL